MKKATTGQIGVKGIRRDPELQGRIRSQREQGTALRAICQKEGLNSWALKQWLKESDGGVKLEPGAPAFRAVSIDEQGRGGDEAARSSPPGVTSRRLYTVYGPVGMRIEGMDAQAVAALMWELSGRMVIR